MNLRADSNTITDIRAHKEKVTEQQTTKLLKQIQSGVLLACREGLNKLFSASDDFFFNLAVKSESNNEYTLFMDTQKEVSQHSQAVKDQFHLRLSRQFNRLVSSPPPSLEIPPMKPSPDVVPLALVDDDDLEIELAIANTAKRAREHHQAVLYELTERLKKLLPTVELSEENLPLGPLSICSAFSYVCQQQLTISNGHQRIMISLLERYLLNQLGSCYSLANQALIDAGVIPNLQHYVRDTSVRDTSVPKRDLNSLSSSAENKRPPRDREQTRSASDTDDIHDLPSLSLSELSTLLNQSVSKPATYTSYQHNPGPAMKLSDLVHQLNEIQSNLNNLQFIDNSLHTVMEWLLSQGHQQPQSLSKPEDDTINLVAMLFELILEDDNIVSEIRALIGRLQIPMLKVALSDSEFFNNTQHPARRLIDIMAAVGMKLDNTRDLSKDRIYKKIKHTVLIVNDQYTFDESIFSDLVEDLQIFLAKEEKKSALLEQRVRQVEAGKAALKKAENDAQEIIFQKTKFIHLPESIHHFLKEVWLQNLAVTALRFKKESVEWVEACQVVDDLINMFKPGLQTRPQRKHLLAKITQGLARINKEPGQQVPIIKELVAALQEASAFSASQSSQEQVVATSMEKPRIAIHERAVDISERHKTPLSSVKTRSVQSTQQSAAVQVSIEPVKADSIDAAADVIKKENNNKSAIEHQVDQYRSVQNQYTNTTDDIPTGTWFKYFDTETGKQIRCKLSTKLSDAETYLFVNGIGFKVLIRHKRDFAKDIQSGHAIQLDSKPLLGRVMSKLERRLKAGASAIA